MTRFLSRSFRVGLLLSLLAVVAPLPAAAAHGWEQVKTERPDAKPVVKEADFEIKTASGMVLVNSTRPMQIKIFTILGRIVSHETVPAGRSQLELPAHGVYIIKIGDLTCKVAV